jgi:hypothetical protein
MAFRYSPKQPQKFLLSSPFWFWDFDDTVVGQQSDNLTVALENVGLEAITVSGLQLPSGPFIVTGAPSLPLALQSGESATFTVTFSPQARGAFQDSIVILSDDPETPRRAILLGGTGYTMDLAEKTVMYATSGANKLYTVNPATGETVEMGESVEGPISGLAVREKTDGLHAWIAGSVYQVGAKSADLIQLLASSFGGTVNDVAFDGGDALYAGMSDGKLYKINVETGEETLIGTATGYALTGLTHDPTGDFLWAAAKKYPFGAMYDYILKISTSDATPTLVGRSGDNVVTKSLTFDNSGNLYGLKQKSGTDYLVQFDKTTGALEDSVELGTLGLETITMWYDVTTDVGEEELIPVRYELTQNYPNPFNPSTTIEFALPQAGYMTLKVYNILGQEVAALVAGDHAAGTFKATWDASGLPSGVYFYRLTSGEYVQTKKMVLMR